MEQPLHIVCQVPNGGNNGSNNKNPSGWSTPEPASFKRPEMMLIRFALCLRIIEVTTSGLRQLAFAWATLVLLGGYVSNLKPIDFWFVTAILVVEGTRLFTRGFEPQQQSKRTLPLPANSFRRHIQSDSSILSLLGFFMRADFIYSDGSFPYQMRKLDEGTTLSEPKWTGHPTDEHPTDDPLAYSGCEIVKNTSGLPYYLQFFLASASVALSVTRLVQQGYRDDAQINLKYSINIFYSLALGEALMFFLEMGYWICRIDVQKLFKRVAEEYEFCPMGMGFLCHFFNDAYSKCIQGCIFEVLNMNLFSFAEEFLDSKSYEERIIGARILRLLVQEVTPLTNDTLNKIGNSKPVLNRLIEMLNWVKPTEIIIRRLASEIVCKLASDEQHGLLVAAIPQAMKSIGSLLCSSERSMDERSYKTEVEVNYLSTFNQFGLQILERLSRHYDNRWKITSAPGLLSQIVHLTSPPEIQLLELLSESPRFMTVHLALQVLKNLACATEGTRELLEMDIFMNIMKLLKYRKRHLKLQMLGLEILGSLGNYLKNSNSFWGIEDMTMIILEMFFQPIDTVEVEAVCNKAGEVLVMLLHKNSINHLMSYSKSNVVRKLVYTFSYPTLIPTLRMNVACILIDLCAASVPSEFDKLQIAIVVEVMPMVLKTIMEEKKKEKLLEVSIGLRQILESNNLHICENEIKMVGITDEDFVQKLVEILRRYENPKSEVPRMVIYVIELAITLMECKKNYIELFRDSGIEQVLMQIDEKSVEFEQCKIYSKRDLGCFMTCISILVVDALSILSKELN